MPDPAQSDASQLPSSSKRELAPPCNSEERNGATQETVALGVGSRSPVVEPADHEPAVKVSPRGLLPVPPDVQAEIARQEAKHPMTPEYRVTLCNRLTLAHYFSDVEIAFRRTPEGIELLAAGLDEIVVFRRKTTPEERHGVVYGVG
jgi:hypothetical protein